METAFGIIETFRYVLRGPKVLECVENVQKWIREKIYFLEKNRNVRKFRLFWSKSRFFENHQFSTKKLIMSFWDFFTIQGAKMFFSISWIKKFNISWNARTSARTTSLWKFEKSPKIAFFGHFWGQAPKFLCVQSARKCARAKFFVELNSLINLDYFCTVNRCIISKTRF